eukprot:TRINITY_DN3170_c0_g1_i3.p1 TRINITY_DN3170_c0_g1~~TRINITY_DN3170_c0_g1_i3.p1  ORF type:complete len:192 (-),score=12.35 TRINITY_DN3170_c0_g1_i3:227-802(-)
MKITSRIDAYLTNATFPWEKESGTHVTVGALLVYRITRAADYSGEWKFDRLWVKSFPVQTNVLCWNLSLKMLAIGMDDGSIHCLRISTDHKYMQYEEYCTLKLHAARVMGLAIDGKKNWILSVAEDKKFKVADLSYQEAQAGTSFCYSRHPACCGASEKPRVRRREPTRLHHQRLRPAFHLLLGCKASQTC